MVFEWLKKFILENREEISDLVIVFFTDGYDTANQKDFVAESLSELQNVCSEFRNSFKTRFLSIGFSQNHDAVFMNKIAQAGTEIGNFFFIDSSKADYETTVDKSLSESLEIALESTQSVKFALTSEIDPDWKTDCAIETSCIFAQEEVKDDELPEVTGMELNNQCVLPMKLLDSLKASLVNKTGSHPCKLEFTFVENPDEGVRIRAGLKNANKRIFDLI
jgi:hypothetical protein